MNSSSPAKSIGWFGGFFGGTDEDPPDPKDTEETAPLIPKFDDALPDGNSSARTGSRSGAFPTGEDATGAGTVDPSASSWFGSLSLNPFAPADEPKPETPVNGLAGLATLREDSREGRGGSGSDADQHASNRGSVGSERAVGRVESLEALMRADEVGIRLSGLWTGGSGSLQTRIFSFCPISCPTFRPRGFEGGGGPMT